MTTLTADRDIRTHAELLTQLGDDVRELTQPYRHTHSYYGWTKSRNRTVRRHTTQHNALLDQVSAAAALATRQQVGTIGRHTIDGTIPAAVALLADIRASTSRWLTDLGAAPSADLKADLRALVGAAAVLDHDTLARLAGDIRRFHSSASMFGGWW